MAKAENNGHSRMTRDDARLALIKALKGRVVLTDLCLDDLLTAFEAVGVVKFEEPKPTPTARQVIAGVRVTDDPFVREEGPHPGFYRTVLGDGYASRIELALDEGGFEIVPKGADQHQAAEIALRECQTTVDIHRKYEFPTVHAAYQGWLGEHGAAKVIDFLRVKGFRFRCAS